MAIFKFFKRADVKNLGSLGSVIAYCVQKVKTKYENDYLVSGILCTPQTAIHDFIMTKKLFGKEDGMQYYYAIQSFEADAGIDALTAHKMALELAERCYPNHQILIATHTDTDNLHSHIIINSVNSMNGKKIHQNKDKLYECRRINDEICMKYGVAICKPSGRKTSVMKSAEYYAMLNGKSWKLMLCTAITSAMRKASSKEEFIKLMNDSGYEVDWADNHKHITYKKQLDDKCLKCRDDKLHEIKYLKENMANEFTIRQEILAGRISGSDAEFHRAIRELFEDSSNSTESSNANRGKLEEPNRIQPSDNNESKSVGVDTQRVSNKNGSQRLHSKEREILLQPVHEGSQYSGSISQGLQGCENGNGERQESDSRRYQEDTEGCDINCWERERQYFLRANGIEIEAYTRDNSECYNPLDSGDSSSNSSRIRPIPTTTKIESAFDIIESIAEAFNNYDDESDSKESGIDKKEWQKIREKKEAQGLHMGGM